jgi:ribosome-associated toxin RatA of RatAB toxin-antitoxin module
MREVRRSALLPYSAEQLYGLVADVERYPEFLPWCTESRILDRHSDGVTVTLGLASGPAHTSFTTRNRLGPGPLGDHEPGRWPFRLARGPLGLHADR